MRTKAGICGIAWLLPWVLLTSCSSRHGPYPADRSTGPAFISVNGKVPDSFQHSSQWNSRDVCPRGAQLMPFTRYEADAALKTSGEDHYFGRSCQIIVEREDDDGHATGRGPASESDQKVYTVPHGPFVYWWPNGQIMREGRFAQGVPVGKWSGF